MKRTPFKKPTPEELKAKQAIKREKLLSQPRKAKKHPLRSPKLRSKPLKPSKGTKQRVPKKKERTQAKLKKDFDALFSRYIRQKYANEEGMVKCYTCSTIKHWKEIQNGHWIPRNNLATRFSEDNCRPQCVACNMFQKGMPDVFAVNLIKEGVDIVALQQTRYSIFKIDRHWYIAQIEKYQALLESL